MESGPTQPLPDKKLLVFILDRLQKYVFFFSVFSFVFLGFFQKNLFVDCLRCFGFLQFTFAAFLNLCRKDTYGVFSEPVDINEVMICFTDSSLVNDNEIFTLLAAHVKLNFIAAA